MNSLIGLSFMDHRAKDSLNELSFEWITLMIYRAKGSLDGLSHEK